jgi:hypothetical protein
MSEVNDIDPILYLRPPTMDVPAAIALGHSLLAASPAVDLESFVVARNALKSSLTDLESGWNAQADATPAEDPRPADHAMDVAWDCLVGRTQCCANLPAERYPVALRAKEILAIIAPDGTAILKETYRKEWSHIHQRLARVNKLEMMEDLRTLAGEIYVTEVNRAFTEYGRVLGITAAPTTPAATVDLRERLRAFTQRMTDYSLQVLGLARRDEPATVKVARDALKPIDDVRAAAAARRANAAATDTTEAPATPKPAPAPVVEPPTATPKPVTRPSASPAPVG